MYKCELCNDVFKSERGLAIHIATIHKNEITTQQYYDKYLKINIDCGICKTCGNITKFISITKGYKKYCNPHCQMTDPLRKEEYRKNNPFCKDNQQYIKQKIYEKYGVDNVTKLKTVANKISKTKLNYTQQQNDEITKKRTQTNLKRYGVEHVAQCDGIKNKMKRTTHERYGADYYLKTDEFKNKVKIHG